MNMLAPACKTPVPWSPPAHVWRVLQEGAKRVNPIRELMEEHNCELAFEGEALEAAARRLAEEWDLVDSEDF